ncbi:nuclear transport factor 2 family protein [Streptomyces mirabilis]|uniref:nuclear transport factor 2 family protein n=1 Tax=Streptomyces mirabilis TaxID=68239 RepID=UPI0036A7ECA7
MTSPNPNPSPADIVRQQYLSGVRGDIDALRRTMADDIEWTEMAGFPLAGTYRGPDAVISQVFGRLGEEWDNFTAHDDTYIASGEHVVVLARYTATNKHTGKALNARVAHHFTVRGGQIVRFEQFADTALVREATHNELD